MATTTWGRVPGAPASSSAASNVTYLEDDQDDENCPTCVEPFDDSDKKFLPCMCNFRVCMFCVRRIMTEFDGRCPGCRSAYNEANFRIKQVDPEELARQKKARAERKRIQERDRAKQAANAKALAQATLNANQQRAQAVAAATKQAQLQATQQTSGKPFPVPMTLLSNLRVVLRTTIFVQGIAPALAQNDGLRHATNFGQYGVIQKLVVGKPSPNTLARFGASLSPATITATITYARPEEARAAIQGVDGLVVDGHKLRACFATTKYCPTLIKFGQPCALGNDCPYLHQMAGEANTFRKEDYEAGLVNYDFLDLGDDFKVPALFLQQPPTAPDAQPQQQPASSQAPASSTTPPPVDSRLLSPFEKLGGIELALFEKQRGGQAVPPQTMSRQPGGSASIKASRPATPLTPSLSPTDEENKASTRCTEVLGLLANLIVGLHPVPRDLKYRMSFVCGPRVSSFSYSGLGKVLSGPQPIFVAPAQANTGPALTTVAAPEVAPSSSEAPVVETTNGESESEASKKLSRKGRKALARGGRD